MADLGNLVVRLSAETSEFQKDLGKAHYLADRAASQIVGSFAKVGTGILAGLATLETAQMFAQFVKGAIDAADKLDEMAERTGFTVEKLSELSYAARQSGIEVNALEVAFKTLNDKAFDAATGNKQTADLFQSLGVKVKTASGEMRASQDVFEDVASAIANIENPAVRSALSVELFGKSGLAMAPLLANFKELKQEAHDLGAVIGEDFAKQSAQFNDNLERMSTLAGALGRKIASELLPPMNNFLETLILASRQEGGLLGGINQTFSLPVGAFADAGKYLKDYREELERLEKAYESGIFKGAKGVLVDIEDVKKKIALLKQLELKQAQAGIDPSNMDARDRQAAQAAQAAVDKARKSAAQKFDLSKFGKNAEDARKKLEQEAAAIEAAKAKILGLRGATELEKVGEEISTGKFKDFSMEAKTQLLQQARAYDELKRSLDNAKIANEEFDKAFKAQQDASKIVDGFIARNAELAKSVELEKELALLPEVEAERRRRLFDLDKARIEAIKQIQEIEDNGARLAAIETLNRAYEKQREVINGIAQSQRAANDDFFLGAKQGLADYMRTVENNAEMTRRLVTNAFKGMEDALVQFAMTGKLNFRDLANSIIADLIRIQIRKTIVGFFGDIFSGFAPGAGGGGGAVDASGGNIMFAANGGVMTAGGAMPLRRYASGGVANSPQMAVFGEGSMAEAYVPLPDGRSIPVTLSGGGGTNVVVNVNVESGQTSAVGEGEGAQLGKLIAGVVQAEILKQKRNGGLLAA